jgi:hypothetical protein
MRRFLIRCLSCQPKLRWNAIVLYCKYAVSYTLITRSVVCIDLNEGNLHRAIIEYAGQNRLTSRSHDKVAIQIPIDRRQLNVQR